MVYGNTWGPWQYAGNNCVTIVTYILILCEDLWYVETLPPTHINMPNHITEQWRRAFQNEGIFRF